MNIHVLLDVLPNRKWHHTGGSTHFLKKGERVSERGGRQERKEETPRKGRESQGKVIEEYGK